MPGEILNRFVVLDDWRLVEGRLFMRFVPDHFDLKHDDPVLRIEMDTVEDEKALVQRPPERRPAA